MSNNSANISAIGKEILQAIENQRLTKKYVYTKMGISRGTLDNWISGATAPGLSELQQLRKILDINVQRGHHERSFRDEIFEGDYIGLHKRVWDQLEKSMNSDRELLKQAMAMLSGARNS
jgi:transcriptional regulator with XRE-family HTH domain